MPVLDQLLTTPLSADRVAVLDAFQARVEDAYAPRQATRATTHMALAEKATRIDLKKLRSRLAKDIYPVAGRAPQHEVDLRAVLDHTGVPAEITSATRLALAAKDDASFNAATVSLKRDTDRYAGHAEHTSIMAQRLDAELAVLENAAARLFSAQFVVTEPHGRTWTATH
jgi:hypothetical protein